MGRLSATTRGARHGARRNRPGVAGARRRAGGFRRAGVDRRRRSRLDPRLPFAGLHRRPGQQGTGLRLHGDGDLAAPDPHRRALHRGPRPRRVHAGGGVPRRHRIDQPAPGPGQRPVDGREHPRLPQVQSRDRARGCRHPGPGDSHRGPGDPVGRRGGQRSLRRWGDRAAGGMGPDARRLHPGAEDAAVDLHPGADPGILRSQDGALRPHLLAEAAALHHEPAGPRDRRLLRRQRRARDRPATGRDDRRDRHHQHRWPEVQHQAAEHLHSHGPGLDLGLGMDRRGRTGRPGAPGPDDAAAADAQSGRRRLRGELPARGAWPAFAARR